MIEDVERVEIEPQPVALMEREFLADSQIDARGRECGRDCAQF
jgi:hypothetical protein